LSVNPKGDLLARQKLSLTKIWVKGKKLGGVSFAKGLYPRGKKQEDYSIFPKGGVRELEKTRGVSMSKYRNDKREKRGKKGGKAKASSETGRPLGGGGD